ncbi:MAG: TRIC cation channel family protein [Aquificaceae bacterium]
MLSLLFEIDLFFQLINLLGIATFSVAGSLKGIREGLDLLGIATLGVITSLGGGILRDIMVGRIPNALVSPYDMTVALVSVIISLLLYRNKRQIESKYAFLMLDAIGLSAFTTTGAILAYKTGVSFYGVVLLATITGVGGGVMGDVLLRKVPWVLREDFYATCSIIGAVAFYISVKVSGDLTFSSIVCFLTTLTIRTLAIVFKWRLPKAV